MLRRRLTISGPLRALIGFGYLSTAKPVQGAETPSLPTLGHTMDYSLADIQRSFLYLRRAINLVSPHAASGLCFHRSVALCLDMPTVRVALGVLREATPDELATIPNASNEPFVHCWTENGSYVYAPTTIEACDNTLVAFPKEVYYGKNGITGVCHISRKDINALARSYKWRGAFKHGFPYEAFPPLVYPLLRHARMPYRVSDDGGILPLIAVQNNG